MEQYVCGVPWKGFQKGVRFVAENQDKFPRLMKIHAYSPQNPPMIITTNSMPTNKIALVKQKQPTSKKLFFHAA